MSLELCICFTEQTSTLEFQCVVCDAIHLVQKYDTMRSPGLLCTLFKSIHPCQHFRSRHVRGLCNCHMNCITSCLLVFLSSSSRSRPVGSFERCYVALANEHVALPTNSYNCEHSPHLWSFVYFSPAGLVKNRSMTSLRTGCVSAKGPGVVISL